MDAPLTIQQHLLVRVALPVVDEEAAKMKRKYGAAVELDELLSIGKLALYDCVRRFKEGPGRSFEGFARFRVRGAMMDHVRCATREARIQREMARTGANRMSDYHDEFNILQHTRSDFEQKLDLFAEHHTTAMWLGGAMRARREAEQDPEAAAEYANVLAALDRVLAALSEDERHLLDLVFASDFKIEEAAEATNVVRETAGRRIKRMFDKLRRQLVALGVSSAPEPMNHPGVRPVLVRRGPPPEPRAEDLPGAEEVQEEPRDGPLDDSAQ